MREIRFSRHVLDATLEQETIENEKPAPAVASAGSPVVEAPSI